MINYFPYAYPLPEDRSAPFAADGLSASLALEPDEQARPHRHQGVRRGEVRAPRANLVLLIDTSGSMAPEDRLPLLKNAFRMLIDTLQPDDTVGIVTYAGQRRRGTGAHQGGRQAQDPRGDRAPARQRLDGKAAAGIQGAYRAWPRAASIKNGVNRVILATDGDFNVGITDRRRADRLIEESARPAFSCPCSASACGNLKDAHDARNSRTDGNGDYAYIDTLNEARKVLVDEVGSTLFTIAKDVKIQIEFNPATVSEYRLIGYENRLLRARRLQQRQGRRRRHGLRPHGDRDLRGRRRSGAQVVEDLRYQQPATAIKEGKGEYGFLRINYKLPTATVSRRIELPITQELQKTAMDQVSTEVRFSIAVAAFGQLLRGEPYLKSFGYDEAIALAAAARGEDLFGYRAEFLNLVRLSQDRAPLTFAWEVRILRGGSLAEPEPHFRFCDGFRMPAQHGHIHAHDRAGVRKPPGKEGARLGHPAQRALWGFGGRRRVQRVPVKVSIGLACERLPVDLGPTIVRTGCLTRRSSPD